MLQLPNTDIPYFFKESGRAKHVRIAVTHLGVEIVMPRGASRQKAYHFMCSKQGWIEKHWRRLHADSLPYDVPFSYSSGDKLLYRGEGYVLTVESGDVVIPEVVVQTGKIYVYIPRHVKSSRTLCVQEAIEAFFKQALIREVERLIEHYGQQLGLYPVRYTLGKQRTRWGSCSSNGHIRINLALIMAPEAVLAYVIVHELCHLKHANHSKRFWSLVASVMPDYPIHRQWLRTYSSLIAVL